MSKIDKNKIIKYAGLGIITSSIICGTTLTIIDKNIDHTEKICPITKMGNITNSLIQKESGKVPYAIISHQLPEMISDFEEKGIKDLHIIYSENYIEKSVEKIQIEPITYINENGNLVYMAPENYYLVKTEDGNYICEGIQISETYLGNCIVLNWGEYNENTNSYEYSKALQLKK